MSIAKQHILIETIILGIVSIGIASLMVACLANVIRTAYFVPDVGRASNTTLSTNQSYSEGAEHDFSDQEGP